MIDLHTVPTPNGNKISIALEELGLDYRVIPYDISQGDQFSPELLALNPNNKLPVIVDNDAEGGPITVFESGAILIYLAEKSGQLLSRQPSQRYAELQWLMFQMAGVGPLQGQAHHFDVAPVFQHRAECADAERELVHGAAFDVEGRRGGW